MSSLLSRLAALSLLSALGLGCDETDVATGDEQDLEEGPALAFDEYTVLFTNPTCRTYAYGPDQSVVSVDGTALTQKPKDVWCSKADTAASSARPESPQAKLLSWIGAEEVNEVFFAYFTMSNAAVTDALCKAVEQRDVKVTMVLDKSSDLTRANQLLACKPASGDEARAPRLLLRGGEGNIALQHNKLFAINPRSEHPRFVFSSGNMSSGVVLHHENWHFIAPSADTFFTQAHLCLMDGLESHASSKGDYSGFIKSCKAQIPFKEERDVKTLFTPGEGDRAFNLLSKNIKTAASVDVAVHRFTHKGLAALLGERLAAGAPVRFVSDDDLYWAGKGQIVGGNDAVDVSRVTGLVEKGLDVRYMETNHVEKLLHHNKFVVVHGKGDAPSGVLAGSGNFTGSGFSDNFENFYWVSVPSVIEQFDAQYDHLFEELATPPARMPTELVVPEAK